MRLCRGFAAIALILASWISTSNAKADFEVFTNLSAYQAATQSLGTVIDFEGIAADGSFTQVGTSSSGSLAAAGVDFSIDGATSTSALFVMGKGSYYAGNSVLSAQYYNTSSDLNIVVKLPVAAAAFAVDLGGFSGSPEPLTITLSSGESFTTTAAAYPGLTFVGFVSDTPFTSLKISDPTAAANQSVLNADNFLYGFRAIPTPSSLALLVIGGLGMIGGLRRRSSIG